MKTRRKPAHVVFEIDAFAQFTADNGKEDRAIPFSVKRLCSAFKRAKHCIRVFGIARFQKDLLVYRSR